MRCRRHRRLPVPRCWARRHSRSRWSWLRAGGLTSLHLCGRCRSHRRLLVPRCWARRHRRSRWSWLRAGGPTSLHLCGRCRSHRRLLVPRCWARRHRSLAHQHVSARTRLSLISWRQAVQRRRCFPQSASHSLQSASNQNHVMRIGHTRGEMVPYPCLNLHQSNPLGNCNIILLRVLCSLHAALGEAWLGKVSRTRNTMTPTDPRTSSCHHQRSMLQQVVQRRCLGPHWRLP